MLKQGVGEMGFVLNGMGQRAADITDHIEL